MRDFSLTLFYLSFLDGLKFQLPFHSKVPDLIKYPISHDAEKPHVSSEVTESVKELPFQAIRLVTHQSPYREGSPCLLKAEQALSSLQVTNHGLQ